MNSAGKIVQSPEEINKTIKDFSADLYTSNNKPSQENNTFLNNIDLSCQFHNSTVHSKLMPNNKSPGPDSFPAEFYKHFWNVLAPFFNRLTTKIKHKTNLFTDIEHCYNPSFT